MLGVGRYACPGGVDIPVPDGTNASMETTPNNILMIRRTIAYAVTFALFYLLGEMDAMRVWVLFGLFFSGLIAATILSFIFFMFIGTFLPLKVDKWVHALGFATEIMASIVILKLFIPIIPSLGH